MSQAVEKLSALSDETKIQPYFLAYEIEHCFADGKGRSNISFMAWINARWRETCKALNVNEEHKGFYRKQHLEFLASRPAVLEFLDLAA
jgi:hypothetical protein